MSNTDVKWVYSFGNGKAEGTAEMKNLLGGKGANLAEMCNIGIPVPPGFTITTEVCTAYYANEQTYPKKLVGQVQDAIKFVEKSVEARFGDAQNPLLVSVRSGARASMPGMMDTVLNLGLNDETVEGLKIGSGDARFAYDSYRRFIQMYSDVVLGVDHYNFEDILEDYKDENGLFMDADMQAEDWREIIRLFKECTKENLGREFPQDVDEQLWGAIGAVFSSWNNPRANTYRALNNIPVEWGTAVNVQAMVFGNMGENSATGVAFTRNPSTGDKAFFGEFLVNAQGEDVVAGIRTPQNITEEARIEAGSQEASLEGLMPETFAELSEIYHKLESHYRDMQDIEFTIQNGKLWMLQTRSGKRTTKAAFKIAVDMVEEGMIDKKEAILRIDPASLDQLLHPMLDPDAERHVLGVGLPASPGAACGKIVFDPDEAEKMNALGERAILVRIETSPEDIHGMHAAEGILTTRGGMTSHAAVVARGMGKPCVSGAGNVLVDYTEQTMRAGDQLLAKGDIITLDGSTGEIMKGEVPTLQPELSGDFGTIMKWVDEFRTLGVRANADTPKDAEIARNFGSEGIGLCRTEHMFFDADRIIAVREMILAETEEERRKALAKLLPMQRDDFTELFKIMAGLPVTIRLLDPPLNEFLPKEEDDIADVAKAVNISTKKMMARVQELDEFNPMLGHRGCRIAISYPEIAEMQARAILEASLAAEDATGSAVVPEIMVPLIATRKELDIVKERIDHVAADIRSETGRDFTYLVGTMIELPRACLQAEDIAKSAEFFSFGTNDLTQTTFGISRDDSARFLNEYVSKNILKEDPFISIDQEGVGELVRIGVERGKAQRADIKLGICGEHGGDPTSVDFCHRTGLTYVSCSPFRVPIARLAAAQAFCKN